MASIRHKEQGDALSFSRDPFADPRRSIRRVYSYCAYRLGDGPDAEDATSTTLERGLRYRSTYDPRRGSPTTWLIGIARRAVDDLLAQRLSSLDRLPEPVAPERDHELRLDIVRVLTRLDQRDRELIALRYGADLTAKQIASMLEMRPNAVEVALHRAHARVRAEFGREQARDQQPRLRPKYVQ
jgi:RNA polymerase sigma-70 factor (ECF subfamily)